MLKWTNVEQYSFNYNQAKNLLKKILLENTDIIEKKLKSALINFDIKQNKILNQIIE